MGIRNLALLAILGAIAAASIGAAMAQEEANRPIRFARTPSLSPDGRRIAFSYQGDIWTVSTEGGTAARLTLHEAHEYLPQWSPDGRWIAFSSKRDGSYDVWAIPSAGGRPKQLTLHSADDMVCGWSPDGSQVLFSSARETTRSSAIYAVTVDTRASRVVAEDDFALANASFSPDGKRVACTRGGAWTRKSYRGSANAELMLFPVSGGAGEWLSREPENERWPMFTPDGKSVYYVADRDGASNIWRRGVTGGSPSQVTRHREGGLYYPSLSANGERLVYEHDFGIRLLSIKGGEPAEVRIFAPSDDRSSPVRRETFTTGAQEAVLSPDGKQLAFVVHGEVFVQPSSGGEAARMTETPQREQDVAWSPDGKLLAVTSDRDGNTDLFVVDVKAKETRQLTRTPALAEHTPVFSPDGKTLAFVRGYNGTELCTVALEGGEPRVLVRDPILGGLAWSPDGQWIACHRFKSHSAGSLSDVFIVRVSDGSRTNVSRYPVINSGPLWAPDGKRLIFRSSRTGNTNLFALALQEEAEDGEDAGAAGKSSEKKPVEVKIDLDDIHKRARAVTRVEGGVGDYALSPDGKTLVFSMTQLGRADLWKIPTAGGTPTRLTQTGESANNLRFDADGSRVVYLSGGAIKSLPAAGGTASTITFRARMDVDTRAELTQMFDEAWRKMRDAFYDEKMHGADWSRVRESYRPALQDITYKDDFYALFSLALGELNASHTGLSGRDSTDGPTTASVGVELDDTYAGPGVRIRSVMPKGPADREPNRLKAGELILKVDGEAVTGTEQFYSLLADKAGKRVELRVNGEAKDEGARTVKPRAISGGQYRQLEYDRWTKERERLTETQSSGKLGYLHLSAMNEQNLERFRRAVFGDMQEKEGLIIDLRFNGGGSIADEMLAILQDRIFSYRTIRGDPVRSPAPLQVFTRPTVVMINQSSVSNAEAFPWGYKALKLGKVIGVPTYGAVIGTGSSTLIDGSVLRIPSTGAYTLNGLNMENNGCPPDVTVENTPEDVRGGRDRQLERAVEELKKLAGLR